MVQVGRVEVIYWPKTEAVAVLMGEAAEAAGPWPGLSSPVFPSRIRLFLPPSQDIFDSVTQNRLPPGRSGAAFPSTNTIVLAPVPDRRQVLRHEVAHLVLRNSVGRAPLWFDEGYASRAAGEWGRIDALRVNWFLLTGRAPTFPQLSRDLRGGPARAASSYALAITAVLMLERMGGERGLEPLLTAMVEQPSFDLALRKAFGVTLGQFEMLWRKDVKKRYGWLFLFSSFGALWGGVLIVVGGLWWRRRRRDMERREQLDEGWILPDE
ncbi:MAG: hypothetical protein OEZ54_11920 [Gemmatimonadota bacterium]|nr:hypothetical protein [Gemmatimonadota bacterium]